MSDGLIVRNALRQDYEQWLPLWHGYNAFYGRVGETVLADDITKGIWDRFFDPYEPMHALVAEVDGKLIGLAHYIFHRNTVALEPTCYMEDLFTSEASRGAGAGRALIEAVYRQAIDAGAGGLYWHTQETNDTARKLYDKVAVHTNFIVYRKYTSGD